MWLQENGDLVYKDVSSKLLIPERSAHSNSSKRSVHVRMHLQFMTKKVQDAENGVRPLNRLTGYKIEEERTE